MGADAGAVAEAPATLVLTPDRPRALGWAGLALLLVGLALALAVTSDGAVVAWVGAGVAVAMGGYFAVPVVAPRLTTLVLDADGVRGRSYHVEVDLPWDVVQIARVVTVAGEPLLELHVREPSAVGDPWRTRAIGVLLPIGADVAALHAFLAARLGRR